jgi:hypothetical protein
MEQEAVKVVRHFPPQLIVHVVKHTPEELLRVLLRVPLEGGVQSLD